MHGDERFSRPPRYDHFANPPDTVSSRYHVIIPYPADFVNRKPRFFTHPTGKQPLPPQGSAKPKQKPTHDEPVSQGYIYSLSRNVAPRPSAMERQRSTSSGEMVPSTAVMTTLGTYFPISLANFMTPI